MNAPVVSIIIPVRPGGDVDALTSLAGLDYPSDSWEIMVAEGELPSRQRNAAAAAARGEILYFLDDDSRVTADCLRRLAVHFADPAVAAVGGPSLTPASDSPWQRCIGAVLASPVGSGGVRNRYRRSGVVRSCRQNELILCNLAFRRQLFLEAGGLDERLYPNEENELLDRLAVGGHPLLHDPDLWVERSQRPDWKAFVRQMFGYGRGRGEQTRLAGVASPLYFIPLLLLAWLLLAPFLPLTVAAAPILMYSALVIGAAVAAATAAGWRRIPLLAVLFAALHILYGLGLLAGLLRPRFQRVSLRNGRVTLRIIKALDDPPPDSGTDAGRGEPATA